MVTLLYIISLFATCSKGQWITIPNTDWESGQWVKGANGKTCNDVCALLSPHASCNADMQSTITTSAAIKAAFTEAGYECKSVNDDWHRDYAGAPFSVGKSVGDCYFLTPGGSKSVCDANYNPGHSALCYCVNSDINECDDLCGVGTECVNTIGGYECQALYVTITCDDNKSRDCREVNGDLECRCVENVIPVFFRTHMIEIIGALLIINILVMSACIAIYYLCNYGRNKYRTRVYKDIHVTESDEEDV